MPFPVHLNFARSRLRVLPALVLAATCALALLPGARAAWSPPGPVQLARLERSLHGLQADFDPTEQMVRRPFSTPGYHTTLTGGHVHPTRDSLCYALGLLDTGQPENLPRACAILRRVIALQDTDPSHRTYGIWSWFLEEPLEQMNPPDFNWADFNGVLLLQVARDHRARLPADLGDAVEASILHAARAIKNRNVSPSYTNIAILGTYVTLVAGELFANAELRTYGLDRLARIHAHTRENGAFDEYNSPTYTVVALLELARLKAHVRDPGASGQIDDLLHRAWAEIATHFHPPTHQWAGPHSRAYHELSSDNLLALIQRATAGRVDFGVDLPDREDLRVPLACPPDLEPLFGRLTAPRTVTETFVRRTETIGTTYLDPRYALGTVNHGDLWNQRHALLAYFGTAAAPGYLRLRFLKNNYDFTSAIFHSAQRGGLVVGAVNFITNGGDTHISLDRVKGAKIRASDLRLRFELGGPAGKDARIATEPDGMATLTAGEFAFHLTFARAQFGPADGHLTTGHAVDRAWLDVEFYHGEEKEFDLAALDEALVSFALSVGPHGEVTTKLEPGRLITTCDGLTVSATNRPGPAK